MFKQRQKYIFLFSFFILGVLVHASQVYALEKDAGAETWNAVLVRTYMGGEESTEIMKEKFRSKRELLAAYPDFVLVEVKGNRMVLQQNINDISPLVKSNGYFGLTGEGVLTLFDGKPIRQGKIIQSFFQIDTGKLEVKRHMQLEKGIRVENRVRYLNVLETFKAYGPPGEEK
ncbi:hypothetical protein GKZ89_04005 [Bacillus mangrovi]|uniref:Bypass-of-forespore protein C n=1 Tax=Metabacillus mangrovi TaxID=1491830 RepID=A0A7X2V3M5_9BACI|nr:BofC C-terminal domain-containing protein [Metabacillus mangrovi]MTH52560.1 hypothetical protein [Metabacillus mangrovi]